jgi:glycosyltransferase involved in cell wall biosynthesis
MNGRLSVMIPCYPPAADAISRAAKSAAAQLPDDGELVIVPSGPAAAIIHTVDLPAAAVVASPTNPPGLCRNWNRCLELASGDLIHLLHADDTVAPGFYAAILGLAERFPAASIYGTAFRSSLDPPIDRPDGEPVYLAPSDAARFFLTDPHHAAGNAVFTRRAIEALGPFREEFDACPDEEAYLRWASLGGLGFDPRPLYVETNHEGQMRHEIWRQPAFVRMYAGARSAGAAFFDSDVQRLEAESTDRAIVSVALAVGAHDSAAAIAVLDGLDALRPGQRPSRRVRAARIAVRYPTLFRLALLRRRLKRLLTRRR